MNNFVKTLKNKSNNLVAFEPNRIDSKFNIENNNFTYITDDNLVYEKPEDKPEKNIYFNYKLEDVGIINTENSSILKDQSFRYLSLSLVYYSVIYFKYILTLSYLCTISLLFSSIF